MLSMVQFLELIMLVEKSPGAFGSPGSLPFLAVGYPNIAPATREVPITLWPYTHLGHLNFGPGDKNKEVSPRLQAQF